MAQLDLVVEGTLCKQVYPKTAIVEPGTFAIFSVVISRIVQGTIDPRTITKWNGDNEITFKGSVPELRFGTTYRIGAKLVEDPKYGFGYQIAVMNVCADFDSEEGIRRFLSYVLTEKQISALMNAFENPIPVFEAHDVEALCKIKGIKYATAEKILDKYEKSKDNSEAYAELYDFGLTKHMIDKLVAQYKSCQTLIERVRGNPYILIDEVDGIGWQKADNMALKSGIGYDSVFRISAYIKYYLKNLAETDGHTWVPLETLVANVRGLVRDINKEFLQKILRDMLDEKQLYYDREHRRIGLMRYRVLEENIYQDLVRLRDAETATGLKYIDETIAECEQVVGFEYTDEQKTAIKQICYSNVCLLTALAGCVDRDTEFFNGKTWKKISDYDANDLVLQYNDDGTASLTKPLMYIKKPCNQMYHFETKYGVNQTVCGEHDLVYWTPDGVKKSCKIAEVIKKQEGTGTGFCGKFKTSFQYSGVGIKLTDAQIKVMCAVICDGSFYKNMENSLSADSYMRCRFHIKKDRKKEELRCIFKEAGINWREIGSKAKGYTDFYINAPRREKEFSEFWYNCNNHQLQIVCDNIMFWDGSEAVTKNGVMRRTFSTSSLSTANFIQFAYSACGYRASIIERDRSGQKYVTCGKIYTRKSVKYSVVVTNRSMVGICADKRPDHVKTRVQTVDTVDGYKYCFSVESTMLVLRRNGCIFVTGNCGKSSLMYPVTRIFRKNNVEFAQCTLSGKASLNLTELTTEVGQTIHRLLAYDPVTDRFMYNRKSQLPFEAIILDEVSMVGGELFYSLIQSIQTGGRLIMIGDPGQLESIGLCNLISDFVNSHTIEHACLTQIFRQAEASGIITDSIKVYHQQPILPKGFVGSVTHGELEDFDIDVVDDAEICAAKAIESYHNIRFGMNVPAEDIVVVTAKRSLGILSAASLNQRIQSMFTFYGETMTREYTDGNCKYSVCYHIGDRVIVTKNNYQAVDVSGEIQPIYNGNIGTITDIQSKDGVIIVKLPQGYIKLGRSDLASLQLGYAITCAKSQGSGFKYVISVCDPSVPIMLTKEFLYTAITRAKKKCHLIGTSFSINKCIQTTRVIAKQTWLLGLLSGDDQVQCH